MFLVIDLFNPDFTPLYFLSNKMPVSFEFLGLSWENIVACDFAYYTGNVEACFREPLNLAYECSIEERVAWRSLGVFT